MTQAQETIKPMSPRTVKEIHDSYDRSRWCDDLKARFELRRIKAEAAGIPLTFISCIRSGMFWAIDLRTGYAHLTNNTIDQELNRTAANEVEWHDAKTTKPLPRQIVLISDGNTTSEGYWIERKGIWMINSPSEFNRSADILVWAYRPVPNMAAIKDFKTLNSERT